MYTVIGTSKTRAARVLWMLEELELPFDHLAAAPQSDAVRAHNPSGKVPVLIVDGTAISDSTAILTYLADRHGQFTHAPGTIDRARQDSLTQFVLDEADAVIWTAARHSFILPEEWRMPAIKPSLKWEFGQSQRVLVARIGDGPFAMGATMTVPDFILTHCLLWAQLARFPIVEPALEEYLERMRARPAFLRAMAR